MKKSALLFTLLLCLFSIPVTLHAQVNDECTYYCHSYDNCDTACEICDSYNPQTNTCEHWAYSTCCEATFGECGGCALVDSWTEDSTALISTDGPWCMFYRYWYGYDNYSRYWRHGTRITHTTHNRYVCNGVEHWETVVTYTYGECFEFFQGTCDANDPIPVDGEVNDRECP